VEKLEIFLKAFATVLHENHVILLDKKKTLISLYGGTLVVESDPTQCQHWQMTKGKPRSRF
jgi:hypothetical protein